MGRGNKIANNATLFVVVIVTAFISHVVTLSMMPPVGMMSVPDHMITFQKLTLRGRPRNKTVIAATKPPTLSAVAQLLAGISTDKPLVPMARTLPATKATDLVVKPDDIPLKSAPDTRLAEHSLGSSLTKKENPKSVGPRLLQTKKSITSSRKPIDRNIQADSLALSLTKKNDSSSGAQGSQQKKSISLWGKPKDENIILNVTQMKSPQKKVMVTPSLVAAVNSTQNPILITQAARKPNNSRVEIKIAPLGESKWIENVWHPSPGGILYDLQGLKKVFGRFNILWLGDDAFRYTYSTLIRVLQAKGPDLSSVFMKRLKIRPCTTDDSLAACTNYHGVSLDYAVVNCFMEMRHLILNRNVSKYTVVVVDFGQQEMLDNCPFVISNKQKMFVDVSQRIQALPTNVAWTTLAWADPEAVGVNHKVMDSFEKGVGASSVTIFDYGAGMQQREKDVHVNLNMKKVDYSEPARIAYIQMLANHLTQHFPDP